jgi:hypothetical protein
MKTLAALLFIAGMAALAIQLARLPTVADGRVVAADRLEEFRKDGVTGLDCDAAIPIRRDGASFTCVAVLGNGATQVVDFLLKPDGTVAWKPQPPTRAHAPRPAAPAERPEAADPAAQPRKPASGDPWANRP